MHKTVLSTTLHRGFIEMHDSDLAGTTDHWRKWDGSSPNHAKKIHLGSVRKFQIKSFVSWPKFDDEKGLAAIVALALSNFHSHSWQWCHLQPPPAFYAAYDITYSRQKTETFVCVANGTKIPDSLNLFTIAKKRVFNKDFFPCVYHRIYKITPLS